MISFGKFSAITIGLLIFLFVSFCFVYIPAPSTNLVTKTFHLKGGSESYELVSIIEFTEKGGKGIELDVHFVDGEMLLGEERRNAIANKSLLEDVLDFTAKEKVFLWLDYKSGMEGVSYMAKLFDRYKIEAKALVETPSLLGAARLRLKKVPVLLRYEKEINPITNFVYEMALKAFTKVFKIQHMSSSLVFQSDLKQAFNGYKRFTFLVTEIDKLVIQCDNDIMGILTSLDLSSVPQECL